MIVTPWQVKGKIDYRKLVKQFGTEEIDEKLLNKIKRHTKELHFMLRRKIFFSHRDLNWLLNEYEKSNKFFLYTGRAPSEDVHLGHLLPWIFTKWLQDKFNAELWFQFPDEEKFLFKEKLTLEDTSKYFRENALDVIALGFKEKKTKFLVDTLHANLMYKEACRVAKKITFSTAKAAFGFTNDTNIGSIFYTSMQAVPAFLPDTHFRVSRDVIPKLGYHKPSLMHCRFLPGLSGSDKMSASVKEATIYTTDNEKEVERKIKKYAFSGGQATIKEHREKGGNPDIDVSYQYLYMLFEPDDKKLENIYNEYKNGSLLTSELKDMLIDKINKFLKKHQREREKAKKKLDRFIFKE